MGARQRAQKRGKTPNKAAKGSLKGSPISQKKGSSSLYVSDLTPQSRSDALLGWQNFASSSSPNQQNGFSMAQQARNTERHTLGWGNTKLRSQGINFVSSGTLHQDLKPDDSEDTTGGEPEFTPGPSEPQDTTDNVDEESIGSEPPQIMVLSQPIPETVEQRSDAQASSRTAPSHADGTGAARDRSSSTSSSEAERIVFRGRQHASVTPSLPASRTVSTAKPGAVDTTSTKTATNGVKSVAAQPAASARTTVPAEDRPVPSTRLQNIRVLNRGRPSRKQRMDDEEEAIMQDYIANMAMDDSDEEEESKTAKPVRKNEHFRMYDGSGEENVKVKLQSGTPKNGRTTFTREDLALAMDWDSGDLEDFDDFSTTDEEILDVKQILRQRERPSGLQYLVTSEEGDPSDAKWVLHKKLITESAIREIRIFEEIQAMEFEEASCSDDDDSTDNEAAEALNDLIDHIQSEDEEQTRIMEHTSRMTDEQIARTLAKQEELGLGGDELVLFNGDIGDESDEEDAFGQNDDFVSFSLKQHTSNRGRSKRNKKQRDSFPSAEAFADALDQDPYGAFDIMNFDRPSLRSKKKGRKSDYPFDLELEDDDLKDQLVSTWMKDREKKAARKRAREEGRMTAAFDAAERSEPSVIKAEIRRFLMQEIDELRLGPMESHVRASVHRLAKAFKLNSRSEGQEGKGGRYPVLTKTIRTPSYTYDTIWEIDALMNTRKFFPKHANSYKSPRTPRMTTSTRTRRGGGAGGGSGRLDGATYMNGEVVGASAPELGADNKGRLLLEKMGWSSGMGIGKEGNKGSLEAIKHVVKTTKAGLG